MQKNMSEVVKLCQAGNPEEGMALYNREGSKLLDQMRPHINKMTELENNHAEELNKQNDEDTETAIRNMIIQILVGLIIMVVWLP